MNSSISKLEVIFSHQQYAMNMTNATQNGISYSAERMPNPSGEGNFKMLSRTKENLADDCSFKLFCFPYFTYQLPYNQKKFFQVHYKYW